MPFRSHLLASAALLLAAAAGGARADTLEEALVSAYNTNPQLLAERANVRAVDEGVPQALAGWRPTVQFTGSTGIQQVENTPPAPPTAPSHTVFQPKTADVNITQPLYQGGQTVAPKTSCAMSASSS